MPDFKPELSNESEYWIPKHRYYELKHFCLQYPEWKKIYNSLGFKIGEHNEIKGSDIPNPTEREALIRAECKKGMELVEKCAEEAFPELWYNLLLGVTEGWTYDMLHTMLNIPCSRGMYYNRYRKFFYILSQRRGL